MSKFGPLSLPFKERSNKVRAVRPGLNRMVVEIITPSVLFIPALL